MRMHDDILTGNLSHRKQNIIFYCRLWHLDYVAYIRFIAGEDSCSN
jgi:hypothetical protein